jgi:hypothetical protein
VEVIGPGRQDRFLEPQSCFRSAHLACGTAHFAFFHRVEPVSALGYAGGVSPTILRVKGFRFYFFSREELRAHVHVHHAEGEAKFWIEPAVELHANYGLKARRLAEARTLVEEHVNEIRNAWAKHFPG